MQNLSKLSILQLFTSFSLACSFKNVPSSLPRVNLKKPAFHPISITVNENDNRSLFLGKQHNNKIANTCLLFQDQRQSIWQGIEVIYTDSFNAPNSFHVSLPHSPEYRKTHSKLLPLIQDIRTFTTELNDAICSIQRNKSPYNELSRINEKHFKMSKDEIRMEYHIALELARAADLKYGTCSRQSSSAWAKVDDIYKYMQVQVLPSPDSENCENIVSVHKLHEIIEVCRYLEQALSRLEKE